MTETTDLASPAAFNTNAGDLDLQVKMLKRGHFVLDGWCSAKGWAAARALFSAGLVRCTETGSDEEQYTAVNYHITDRGREALASLEARA